MNDAWLVVGLGNPGPEYAATRHNVGAMALETWAVGHAGGFSAHRRTRAQVATGRVGAPGAGAIRVLCARTRSFMNESGGPVASLLAYYQIPVARLVVMHDELDLPFGGLRVKLGGGDNGHNGLKSIRSVVGGDFYRIRIGIGRPPGRQDPADFVLRPFAAGERAELPLLLAEAAEVIDVLIGEGLARAQNIFNR